MSRRRAVPGLLTAAYLGVVLWATLGPVSWHPIGWEAPYGVLTPSIWSDPDTWSTGEPVEFAANIVMFAPLGALFATLMGPRRWFGALVATFGVSVAIELVQIPIDDRISDPRDLVANAIGGAIGVGVVLVLALVRATVRGILRLGAIARSRQAGAARSETPASGSAPVPQPAPEPVLSRTGR